MTPAAPTPGGRAPTPGGRSRGALARAVELFARIRRDGEWEAAQTHESLLPYLIEETWELVDCVTGPQVDEVAGPDRDELASELGDLLLQVLFHSAIAAEHPTEPFDVDDVAQTMLDKLCRRAPYWFADDPADDPADAAAAAAAVGPSGPSGPSGAPGPAGLSAAEQDRLWQEAKAAERADRPPRGVLEGITWDMPALALGQKVLARVAAAGFPDDLVPSEMTTVHVDPIGAYHESETGSAEVVYRSAVRRFAARVEAAEARLGGPGAPRAAGSGAAADAAWRDAWLAAGD